MSSENLRDWVVQAKKSGKSEDEIKNILLKNNYRRENISAILLETGDSWYSPLKPSFLKLIIPIIFLIIGLIIFLIDMALIPGIIETQCQIKESYEPIIYPSFENTTVSERQEQWTSIREAYRVSVLKRGYQVFNARHQDWERHSQFHMYFYDFGIVKLNPLYPIPCSGTTSTETFEECRLYADAETYACAYSPSETKEMTIGYGLFHLLLLFLISYLLVCWFSVIAQKIRSNKYRKYWSFGMLILFTLILFLFDNILPSFFFAVPLFVIFFLGLFIKNRKKLYFYSIGLFIVLLSLTFLFNQLDTSYTVINGEFALDEEEKIMNYIEKSPDYQTISCDYASPLSSKELSIIHEFPIPDNLNSCDDCKTKCNLTCTEFLSPVEKHVSFSTYEENPVCVCGCNAIFGLNSSISK